MEHVDLAYTFVKELQAALVEQRAALKGELLQFVS